MTADITKGLELRSLIKSSGELEISLQQVTIPSPGADEGRGLGSDRFVTPDEFAMHRP